MFLLLTLLLTFSGIDSPAGNYLLKVIMAFVFMAHFVSITKTFGNNQQDAFLRLFILVQINQFEHIEFPENISFTYVFEHITFADHHVNFQTHYFPRSKYAY